MLLRIVEVAAVVNWSNHRRLWNYLIALKGLAVHFFVGFVTILGKDFG